MTVWKGGLLPPFQTHRFHMNLNLCVKYGMASMSRHPQLISFEIETSLFAKEPYFDKAVLRWSESDGNI